MAENYDTDDTFLGRWIAGELSEQERIAFEKTKAYKQFNIINKEVQLLEGPNIDTEAALKAVKLKLKSKQKRTNVIKLWQSITVAAIIIISSGLFLNSSKTYTTAIGETQNITLADGSIVNLNANSSITLKRFFWNNDRQLNLTGEAYFTVTKGNDFIVNTSKGIVKVLGTQFNIKDRSFFELKCYKGKVSFNKLDDLTKTFILTKGMQVNISDSKINEGIFEEQAPKWKQGVSSFKAQPFSIVLEELSNYYSVTFETSSINTNRLFTGNFSHKNLDTALKTTLVPMGITYKKSSNENIIMLQNK
ncbi:FecR family protein [uncultured Lacinutrix sp.]|uniref:FecR family protein n=1 Tax=uncultured Lacinutrix sp. TaxID=574032 RepID=UPI002620C8D4|nr:FecR family protein [uncultured Lacinutrix sp.]